MARHTHTSIIWDVDAVADCWAAHRIALQRDLDSIDQCVMCGIQLKTVVVREKKVKEKWSIEKHLFRIISHMLEDENLYSKCYYMYLSTIFIFIHHSPFTIVVVARCAAAMAVEILGVIKWCVMAVYSGKQNCRMWMYLCNVHICAIGWKMLRLNAIVIKTSNLKQRHTALRMTQQQ